MKLFWIDMEMTGLDVEKERVIEVAAIITDLNFVEQESYHSIIKQDQKFIEGMDEWNRKTHGDSGLIAKIPYGKTPEQVEQDLSQLLKKHFPDEKPILAGNSIGQDRLFIDKYFRNFASKLHYRMLDVTSWKILMTAKYNIKFQKQNKHQALDDIRESIQELKYYLQFVKV